MYEQSSITKQRKCMSEAHSQSNCIPDGKSRSAVLRVTKPSPRTAYWMVNPDLAVLRVTLKCISEAHSQSNCILDEKSRLAVLRATLKV